MTKRMLIDATHAEETRVVVLDGNRLEDFDVETAAKKQLKGNIYLAKVVRVEPSLQAAFVEYGGGRHGFLAFSEIHPDYYQIPVADRQRLLAMQEAEARAEEEADDAAAAAAEGPGRHHREPTEPGAERIESSGADHFETFPDSDEFDDRDESPAADGEAQPPEHHDLGTAPHEATAQLIEIPEATHAVMETAEPAAETTAAAPDTAEHAPALATAAPELVATAPEPVATAAEPAIATPEPGAPQEPAVETPVPSIQAAATAQDVVVAREDPAEAPLADRDLGADTALEATEPATGDDHSYESARSDDFTPDETPPEAAGDREDAPDDDSREARAPARFMRSYKIQEVIRRRQILLIQVVKEERGSKGAALTTYISLAGRFSVLMPNSPRGGGISRKITSTADRRRLKEVTSELQIPRGMGLIVRTAGANRPKAEIKRDCEYLLELWDSIRETTMASMAPALIHEEANLIKRAIRDNYSRDVDEVLVDGEAGWRAARDFMRMLMPAHARKVQLWNQPQPLFAAQSVEAQLDSMLVPTVQLKSGGYLVINQTEALVAIDVNSGRSTRERGIEETALKTNLEASDEVARQLRLRDLAGLIVIDFIDMESRRNNAAVEKRMKDALKDDRARIQLGSISHFGLMEMSRQRLRPSLTETSFIPCPHCGGTGHVRSTETSALAVLRAIEEEGAKRRAAEIVVNVAGAVALYILNHKRVRIAEIEARYGMTVAFAADESLLPPQTRIERLRAQVPGSAPLPTAIPIPISTHPIDAEDDIVEEEDDETEEQAQEAAAEAPPGETAEEQEQRSRKRRRRRRGSRREEAGADAPAQLQAQDPAVAEQPDLPMDDAEAAPSVEAEEAPKLDAAGEDEARSRRRGRRGGRRRRRESPDGELAGETQGEEGGEEPASFDAPQSAPQQHPVYAGPTPADPFGGGDMFDIFDVLEQAAERATAIPAPPPEPPPYAAPDLSPAIEAAIVAELAGAISEGEAAVAARADVAGAIVEDHGAELAVEALTAEPSTESQGTLPSPEAHSVEPVEPAHTQVTETAPGESEPAHPASAAAVPDESEPHANGHAQPPAPTETAGPAPVVIGSDDLAGEKKRGWWRR